MIVLHGLIIQSRRGLQTDQYVINAGHPYVWQDSVSKSIFDQPK